MALSAVGLGVGTILMKLLPQNTALTPGQVAVWRFLIAAPLLWVVTLLRRKKSPSMMPQRPWQLLGLGVIYTMASLLALLSLGRLPSSIYVILVYVYPSFVVVYAMVTCKPIPRLWWLGLPLSLIGLGLTVFQFGQPLQFDGMGIILAILNGLVIAIYMISSEAVFKHVADRQLGTTWMNTGAMLMGLSLIAVYGFRTPATLNGWLLLVSLGVFATLVPILAMNFGIQMIGAARSSFIATLQPVVAVLISTLFLGDVLTGMQWIGGALVIIAIVLLQRSPDKVVEIDGD
ncbi:DMT family transporter [bacterium]|nr:DMT family transporter [bacterium]